jgi:hypothetical protein
VQLQGRHQLPACSEYRHTTGVPMNTTGLHFPDEHDDHLPDCLTEQLSCMCIAHRLHHSSPPSCCAGDTVPGWYYARALTGQTRSCFSSTAQHCCCDPVAGTIGTTGTACHALAPHPQLQQHTLCHSYICRCLHCCHIPRSQPSTRWYGTHAQPNVLQRLGLVQTMGCPKVTPGPPTPTHPAFIGWMRQLCNRTKQLLLIGVQSLHNQAACGGSTAILHRYQLSHLLVSWSLLPGPPPA